MLSLLAMSRPQRPVIHFTIGDYLKSWRDMAGLSQSELADLSYQLFEDGVITTRYTQGLISRMEKSVHPDMRDHNLTAICTVLAVALQRAGHEDVQAEDLIKALRSVKRKRPGPGEVDETVLRFNALLQGYPAIVRRMFWRAAEAMLLAIAEQFEDERTRVRNSKNSTEGSNSEN